MNILKTMALRHAHASNKTKLFEFYDTHFDEVVEWGIELARALYNTHRECEDLSNDLATLKYKVKASLAPMLQSLNDAIE